MVLRICRDAAVSQGCLIVGANSRISLELGHQLLKRGVSVWVHAADGMPEVVGMMSVTGESSAIAVNETLVRHAEIRTVVFDLPLLDEKALLESGQHDLLCERVQAYSLEFFATLQVAVRQLISVGYVQIWVLVREDSFHYHLDVPAAPILSHLRCSTVRTVAKEVARFGMRLNAAVLHYGAEELSPETWRAGREGLKSYAQKYKPFTVADMAGHLLAMICNPALPVHGAVMQLGCGGLENNI